MNHNAYIYNQMIMCTSIESIGKLHNRKLHNNYVKIMLIILRRGFI